MPSNAAGIYKIENQVNGKCYVGSAVMLGRRMRKHKTELNCGKHCNQKLQRAWNKYGQDAFVFAVLERVESPSDLIAREQHWIDRLGSVDGGYNICAVAGSCLGVKRSRDSVERTAAAHRGAKRSDETRARIREARAKQAPMSAEGRAKVSAALAARVISDETRAKLSAARKGVRQSDAAREANRRAHLGIKPSPESIAKGLATRAGFRHSEESKRKMSEWQIGRKMSPESVAKSVAARAGYKHSEETRKKMSAALSGMPKSPEHIEKMRAISADPEVIARRLETMRRNKEARISTQSYQK